MTFGEAAVLIRGMGDRIGEAGIEGARDAVDFGVERAMFYSSGTSSRWTLRKMDYPYAKRHGSPLLPAHIINVQDDEFRPRWHGEHTQDGGRVVNDSPIADFLDQGTPVMFRRGIRDAIEADLRPEASKAVRRRIREATRQ